MALRWFAAVVFCLLTLGGLVTWIGSAHELQAAAGFASFLTGLVGLLLVDIAMSLGSLGLLVDDLQEQRAAKAAAKKRDAQRAFNQAQKHPELDRLADDPEDWQNQNVTVDPRRAELAAATAKRK